MEGNQFLSRDHVTKDIFSKFTQRISICIKKIGLVHEKILKRNEPIQFFMHMLRRLCKVVWMYLNNGRRYMLVLLSTSKSVRRATFQFLAFSFQSLFDFYGVCSLSKLYRYQGFFFFFLFAHIILSTITISTPQNALSWKITIVQQGISGIQEFMWKE